MEQFEYLLEINYCGSMHKAADKLHISVQALSVAISALEKELGIVLTVRNKSGTFLTEKGIKLLKLWDYFAKEVEKIKREDDSYENLKKASKLEFFLTSGVEETELPQIVSNLYADFPQLQLKANVIKVDNLLTQEDIIKNSICLLYQITVNGVDMLELSNSDYMFQALSQKKYYCTAHDKFPISQKKTVYMKEILKYQIIIYVPTRKLFDTLLKYFGGAKNVMYVDSFAVYKQMLKDGHGVGLSVIEDNFDFINGDNLKNIPLEETIYSTLGIVLKKDAALSSEIEEFCRYLKALYFYKN